MPKAAQKSPQQAQPLTAEIRSAIADSGHGPYALAKLSGVDEAAIRRFVSRERSLSLESADRIASALGLQLVRKARAKTRPSNLA